MSDFQLERTDSDGAITLRLAGELDLAQADRLLAAGEGVPEGGSLTLDVEGLTFMDSSGLKVFMNLDRRSKRESWSLVIRHPQGQVLRLLKLCGFDQRLPIVSA